MEFVLIAVAILVVALLVGASLLVSRGRRTVRLDDDTAAGTTLTRPRPPQAPSAEPAAQAGATASGQGTTAAEETRPDVPVELPPAEP